MRVSNFDGAYLHPGFLQLCGGMKSTGLRRTALNNRSADTQVTMSNWEQSALSRQQMVYAALDALVTGQLFRGLRLWHSSPSACAGCQTNMGAYLRGPFGEGCSECGRFMPLAVRS